MVGDLGLGKALDMSSRLTMIGGTPTYVAPEQALGEAPGRAGRPVLARRAEPTTSSPVASPSATRASPQPRTRRHRRRWASTTPTAEAVVLQALAKDRADRFEDIESFTAALVDALGGQVDEAPAGLDPGGPRPHPGCSAPPGRPIVAGELPPVSGPAQASAPRGRGWSPACSRWRRRRWRLGDRAGPTAERTARTTPPGTISVTVPEEWTAQVDPEQWTPLEGEQEQPSLASGTQAGVEHRRRPGARRLRRHPGGRQAPLPGAPAPACCGQPGALIEDQQDGDDSMTVFFSGCPGRRRHRRAGRAARRPTGSCGCRSAATDRATANRVLESVTTYGI